jgi:3-hydroxyisobutyrate dehydrogenase-like beta-hydroxyacid dehydrogenase
MSGPLQGQRIGFCGLGLMGRPMCRNLHEAGAALTVHNRTRATAEALAAELPGMQIADSPRDAAAADTVIVNLADTAAVEQVVLGETPPGIAAGVRPGLLVIDMGTTGVEATRRFAAAIAAKGGLYVDAPVSGGTVGAEAATLAIMCGGGDAAFARAKPILERLGKNITHCGGAGAGQVAKLANQMIVALTIGAVAEAFSLARHAGVDPAKVRQALMGGFAASRILELHGQRMVEGAFQPGGRAKLQRKDVVLALELARQVKATLPATELSLTLWDEMLAKGWGDLDHSALYKLYEG